MDETAANELLGEFQAAVSKVTFRMGQSFGYWRELPWALLMIMQPYVVTFSSLAEDSQVQSFFERFVLSVAVHKDPLLPLPGPTVLAKMQGSSQAVGPEVRSGFQQSCFGGRALSERQQSLEPSLRWYPSGSSTGRVRSERASLHGLLEQSL